MCIKATIVAYAFSVQQFENTTIVTYVGLRVNWFILNRWSKYWSKLVHTHMYTCTHRFSLPVVNRWRPKLSRLALVMAFSKLAHVSPTVAKVNVGRHKREPPATKYWMTRVGWRALLFSEKSLGAPAYVLNCWVQIAPASLTDAFIIGNHNAALTTDNIYMFTHGLEMAL